MANIGRPLGRIPFNRRELTQLQREIARMPSKDVRERYQRAWEFCRMGGGPGYEPPRPSFIQEFVQLWRELDRRLPKGRD